LTSFVTGPLCLIRPSNVSNVKLRPSNLKYLFSDLLVNILLRMEMLLIQE